MVTRRGLFQWLWNVFIHYDCQHEWTKVSEKILPPQIDSSLMKTISWGGMPFGHLLAQTHVVVLTCKHCGVVKKIVTIAGE